MRLAEQTHEMFKTPFINILSRIKNFVDKAKATNLYKYVRLFFIWVKKNQKLASFVAAGLTGISSYIVKIKNDDLRDRNLKIERENSFLSSEVSGMGVTMEHFDLPWYRKTKRVDTFRISGMNLAYQKTYGKDKIKSLGKSNYQLAPKEVADLWRHVDSVVVYGWKPHDTIEKDPKGNLVYTHKWAYLDGVDSIVYGVSIPLARLIIALDNQKNIEVLKLVEGNDKLQDTLIIE